ncbi:MAG: HAMP domain-containing histidine kinase [Deltaproteobacteria bacterium]|nr:HAMP domain-containing histidine kinase [Deltaproteobacteria bacterium]
MRGRLFEFFATHGKQEGTGLGLAMCKRIMDAHGGTIECIQSTPQGSTFRVRLPP